MNYLKRQDGVAQLLVVALVVVVIVVIGLAVWQSQQVKTKADQAANTPTSTATVQASSTPAPSTAAEVKVTELGFKMTLPAGLTDLKYVAETNLTDPAGNGKYARASFSTSSLEQKDPASSLCLAAQAPLGVIVRYETEPKGLDSGIPVRKIGNFYLTYSGVQSACSDNDGVPNFVLSQAALLEQAFNTATAL